MPGMISLFRRSGLAAWMVCGGLLLPGVCARSAGPDTPAPATAATAPVSAQAGSFDAVTARLDRGGTFYLYLGTAQWLENLSREITEWRDLAVSMVPAEDDANREKIRQGFNLAASLVQKSGVEQITGVGASSLAVAPGIYRNTFFVHHDKDKETGFLGTLFGSGPHALTGLDFLPADTAAANYGDCDISGFVSALRTSLDQSGIPEVKKAVADGLARFALVTGMSLDDFLQSLGGSSGMVLTLDPARTIEVPMGPGPKQTIPLPRLAVLFEVKNDRVFQRVEQLVGMFPMVQKTDEPGLRMLSMGFPATPQFQVRATVAQWDKFLVLASDDQLVRDMIAARKTGQGFKASPAFARLSAGLPAEGNGFGLATQAFADAMRRFQQGMFENQPNSTPGQAQLMQKIFSYQTTGATYGVWGHVEDGWLNVSNGPQNLGKVVLPLLMVPVAIAAGVALPVYHSVQQKGEAVKSLAQAKQIGLACKLYASDHAGNFPPELDALVPTYLANKSLFISPFAPDEPVGYSYKPGLSTSSPGAAVLLEDKFSAREHQRVVVRVNGSGEITHP
jgi:hypothetical protein